MKATEQLLLIPDSSAVQWQSVCHLTGAPAGAWQSWLQEPHSLTVRLQAQAQHSFAVRVLNEAVLKPHEHEAELLDSHVSKAWVREVLLEVDEQPWVFARSVVPLNSSSTWLPKVLNLGTQPLGQLLFRDARVIRGELVFCAPNQLSTPSLWGRASCFSMPELKVLVAEHFLAPMAQRLNLTGL